jgi:hypothetical protein
MILLGFGVESAGAFDKACLRRLNRVKRALRQGKFSSRFLF